MSRSKRLFNLIAIVAMLSLIVSPLPAPSVQAQGKARAADSGLYRTRIHLPSFVARDRLDKMGVVVLADNSPGLLVLVDGAQLTDLARLRFEPRVTDDLAALLAEAAPEKAWLGIGLQPLLAAARAVVTAEKAGSGKTEALAALRLTMADLPNELRAGISVLNSVDDDADGLTNTEEAWWCTNPLNPNSDGDASGYADGQEVAALLNFTLSRTVRWGYGPPFGPPAAWPNFNNRDGTGVNVCNDGDYDTIPDYAEAYMVGTRVGAGDSENTDGDKFDDGQELFGTTFCPGGTASCGYGNYPRTQDYSFITSGMPSWIRPPGDSPFVSAYPVIDFLVDPATVKVTAKEIRTIERTITQGEEVSTGFAETVGASTTVGTVDTNTHSTWQENSTTEGGIEPGSVAAIQFQVPSTDGSALAWDTSNNSYVPVKPPDPERPLSAADEKAIDFAVAAFAATIAPRPTDYEPFQVEGLRGDGDFAILSLASYPSERPSDAEMIVPQLLIGVAHRETDRWNIYVQGMSAYDNTLRSLPDTILSEAGKAILLTQATPRTTYNVRGLPWKIGTSWRYNQGPHGNENAWDFGTPSAGVAADIYTAESGLVVNSKETCIAIRRPGDGLILWYQHIASSAVKNFPIGSEVGFSQRLGPTTIADGCSGYSTGHHIHFFLNAPMQNPPPPTWKPFDPQGSTLNGWRIAAEKLIKNGVEKLPNQSDKISHDGNQQTDKQACQAPPIKSTDPNQTTPNVSTGNRFVEFFERLGRQVKSWFGLGGGSVRLAGTDSFVSGASGTPLNYSDFRSDQQCGGSPSPSTGSAPGGGGSGITLNDDGDGTFSSLRVWSQTQTTGEGRSTSHSELRSETSYREITRSSTNTLVSSEAWSTATTTDPTDAGQLTFNYNLYNTGSDAAVRLTGLKINVLIGDLPVITWTPADTFFDIFPGQAKGPFSSAPLKLTLEQLAAIDNGAPIRVILADYGYDDNLYDANAWGRSILFHVDDGPGDGDETIDTYLITTNLVQGETYQDTLARYFDATTFQGAPGDERNGTLTAIRTPEFAGDGEITGWNDHPVNDHAWWELSISLGGETDGVQHFRDMPAKAKTDVYLRYVLDTDGDGFSDRAELDAGSDPNDPDIHPRPLITVAQHTTVSGGSASVQVTLQNDGNLDASSVELWAIAADDSITISDNLVGGGGRVRAGRQVVLGARIGKPDLTAWQTSTAKPYPDGQYEGTSPKTFKFQALDSGNIGAGTLRVKWSNDNGATWQPTPLALGSGYTAWTPLALSDGLTVAFSGGYVALNETFTFATALPIDTFAYTINRTPYTPPLIIASYNDPEGNHKFVSDVELPDIQADLAPYLSDMRFGFQLDVMAPAPFATGANTAHLVFNNPAAQAISGTNLYVEFATPDGTVAKEYVLENQTLLPGPTVVTLAWDTADFNPAFDPAADYHILVFAADRQGTIFENTVKKLEQIGHDQLPLAVLPDATWDFGAAQQGTLLKHTMAAANIGYHELLTFVQGGPGLSLSDSGTRHLPAGDLALYDLTLNTAQLPVGPYQSTVTIRTSDPANPTRTVHVVGSVTAAPADNPVGAMQRPLDWPATVSGNQGQWVEFTHTLGPDPQMLHPVKVYSQDYGTLKGVGKYATAFGSATASYDMFGDGRDGVMPSSGNLDYNNGVGVAIVNSGSAGAYSINVTDAYAGWRINPGDAVLIHQTQGAGAGCWELNRAVSDFTGGAAAIQLAKPLQCNYASSGNNHAQIQRVPQYTDCPVSGTVTSLSSWNGTRGGILAVMCNGVMNLSGSLDVSNAGYRGVVTPGSGPPYYDGSQGEGTEGPGGAYSYWPNGNAGGGGRGDNSTGGDGRVRGSGGGGGGNAYSGNTGVPDQGNLHTAGIGGQSSGNPELTSMTFGGAGGAPGYDATTNTYGQRGGNGGGIVVILAKAFSVPGSIIADGETTSTGYGGRSGGHGGGAGGSILIRTSIGALSGGMISARGGVGTYGWQGANGGDGSVGRIRIEHCETFSGSTNPPPSTLHLNCYIAEQVESAPYTTTRLNLPESGSHTYQVQYGRKLHWGGAANQVTTLRVPAALFTSVTLQSLVSDLPSNASFALDIGNTGSDSWNGTVGNGGEYTSPNLAAFFNAYWASHGAPTTGYLDVPMRVYLDRAGQVLLTNLQVTPTGSKLRAIRLPVQPQGYSNVTASFTVSGGSGPLAVGVDVGDNGSVDWTYTGSPTYPASLTTGNLATAINAYLSGRSGEVDVPIRIYLAPFAILNLADFSAAPVGQTDMQIGAGDVAFSAATPVETEPVTVTATLHNPGTLDSGSLTAVFYGMLPSGQPQGLPLQIGAAYVPNIPANGAATASILWDTTGFTGTVPVRVVIDPYNRVAETNEANNEAAASLTILTRPDLRISSLTLSNTEPVTNEVVTVNLTLVNGGQTQATSQTVALYEGNPDAGGSLISAQITAPLPGGTTTLVSLPWTPTTAGEHRLLIRVDRDDQVSESDEGNNDAWRDVYVGLRGPVLLDSGTASDIPYSSATGYGYIDESQPDAVSNCGTQPAQTLRQDPGGRIVYRFDHLLPGHFYHLDLTLFECDGAGRQEDIYVDGNRVAGPENLGDGQVHDLSLRLDPALYADRTIRVTVESPGIDGAVVSAVNLYDIDYRYADAGGNNDPAYPGGTQAGLGRPYGWLDGVPNLAWGTLPYQSVRIDQTDTMLRYQFDGLNPARHYQVHLTLWQPSGSSPARTHTLQIDGIATGVTVNSGDYQIHRVTADVPVAAYSADGRIVTQIIRTGTATTGAFVNEIALEESTLVVMPPEPTPTPTSIPSATPTPTVTPTVTPTATPTATPVPPDATIMHLAPAQAAAYAGVPITVTLGITNAHNLGSFEFTLIYNPTLVNVEAITLGPFPGSTGRTFSPTGPIINNTTGRATFGAFSLGATPPGPSGHGVLASVRLRPMAAGTAIVQVTDAQVADIAGTPLPVAVQHGTLIIQACLGDFDADGDVDIIDVQRIAYRWSSRCGDPLYEARYDLDNDCDIDIIDVQRVAYRWGTHCTTEAPAGRLPWLPLAPVTLRITPSEVALAPGETLALSVSAQQVVDLGAFELTLAYDPAVAEVVGVTLGAFPDSTGRTFVPVGPQINAQTGAAVFGGYSLGAVPPGPSGDGALALVTIRALAPGRSRFEITQAQVSNRAGNLQPVGALSSMEILVRGETHLHLPLLRYDR